MQGLIKTLLFFALLSLSIPGKAQVKVSGRVTDTDGNPVNGAFVIASHPKDSSAIVAYTFTEVDGRFILPFSKTYESVLLVVKCLGYHDIKTLYDFSRTTDLVFSLAKKEMHIKEVVIKSQPIKQQGDTVKYLVSSFAKGKDFSIGDVIKNMPGFQVESDGTILHEGKPISKYYINGLDLLEGGYTVVNKNLPHQAVGSVEVLKKHQPIKILQGVIPTDATALNLKLKNNVTITGSSQLGGGYKPYLYDVNITPMLFQNNQQFVFSLQANNVGQELESQFNIIDESEGIVSGLDFLKPRYVMVSRVPSPSIAMDRYYDNNSQYASFKYLIKMNDRWETKVDANYYSDLSYRKGIVNRTYFFTDSSVNYLETTTNELKNISFRLGTRLSHNSSNTYLNSKTNFTRYWNNDYATIGGTNSIMQNAGYPSQIISNTTDMILKRGRRFHSLYTHLNYLNTNQNLIIEPGVFNEFLNDSISYNRTKQNIAKNSFNFNAFYKFSFALKNWIMELKPEVEIEDGKMQTSIFKDNIMLTADSLISNKRWLMVIPSITPNLRFKSSSLNANINVPIDYRIVNESDVLHASNKQTFTNIKPSVRLDYQINPSWESSLNLFYSHNLSHPSDVLNGYTIKSHTLIYRNNYFNTGKQTYLSGKIKYANPLTGIEWRASYSKKYILSDYILDKQLKGQGILNYTYRKLDNTKIIDNLETVFSYFWVDLSSSFNIKYNYVSIEADQFLSGNVYKTFNYWNSFNGAADIMFFDNLQIKYAFTLDLIRSSFRNVESHGKNFSHELEVTFYTNKKIYYGFEAEYYDFLDFSQSKSKTFFLNAYFNMKFANGRYVLDIACKNLLNSDSFDVYGMDQNMITYSTVLLRPRSFILTLKMPLTHLNGK